MPEQLNQPEEEQGEMTPTEVLQYVAQIGRSLELYSLQAQAMIEEAKERGIAIDLSGNGALKSFAVGGQNEKALINIRGQLMGIGSDLFSQGVKMTKEELDARLEKMDKSK